MATAVRTSYLKPGDQVLHWSEASVEVVEEAAAETGFIVANNTHYPESICVLLPPLGLTTTVMTPRRIQALKHAQEMLTRRDQQLTTLDAMLIEAREDSPAYNPGDRFVAFERHHIETVATVDSQTGLITTEYDDNPRRAARFVLLPPDGAKLLVLTPERVAAINYVRDEVLLGDADDRMDWYVLQDMVDEITLQTEVPSYAVGDRVEFERDGTHKGMVVGWFSTTEGRSYDVAVTASDEFGAEIVEGVNARDVSILERAHYTEPDVAILELTPARAVAIRAAASPHARPLNETDRHELRAMTHEAWTAIDDLNSHQLTALVNPSPGTVAPNLRSIQGQESPKLARVATSGLQL